MRKTAGIPRLQELSYLDVGAQAVQENVGFEEIRRRLVRHMIALRENNPASGNTATFQLALEKPHRYVRNVTDALKELMGLGLVVPATLPSSANAARNYRNTTFALTDAGAAWVELLRNDPRSAYDQLLSMLWGLHPQFSAFVRALGTDGLVIPLAQWGELPEPRSREKYVDFITERVGDALQSGHLGWTADVSAVKEAILVYIRDRYESAARKGKKEPYPRNQDFITAIEEALVKFVFAQCGTPIDYISQEVLRRWTKELGIANFSYHTTGATALKYWLTAEITVSGEDVRARRRVGVEQLERVVNYLGEAYERVKRTDESRSLWLPIHRVRAETCWRLQLPDAVFDRAIIDLLSGTRGDALPYRVNVDPAMYGSVPPSEMPLRIQSSRGIRTYYSMSLVPRRDVRVGAAEQTNERGA